MVRLPKNRPPVHPGEILREEFLEPLGLTQRDLADRIDVSYQRVNELVNGKRGVTADTALRLARAFGTSPDVWINLQVRVDLWEAENSRGSREIEKIRPFAHA
jgi:addiction module HigA family antidote